MLFLGKFCLVTMNPHLTAKSRVFPKRFLDVSQGSEYASVEDIIGKKFCILETGVQKIVIIFQKIQFSLPNLGQSQQMYKILLYFSVRFSCAPIPVALRQAELFPCTNKKAMNQCLGWWQSQNIYTAQLQFLFGLRLDSLIN